MANEPIDVKSTNSETHKQGDNLPQTFQSLGPIIRNDSPKHVPDFAGFASAHPWIGQKMGEVQVFSLGFGQQYQAATLYGGTFGIPLEVHGPIRDKYIQKGGPDGFLGYPTTNETGTPDGKGRFNHFEHGSIYWHPFLGAFEVHGAIRDQWRLIGWEGFGYPMTDESSTLDQIGRFNHFRLFLNDGSFSDRSIYFHPNTGPQDVRDGIRMAWSNIGWEMSFLGYPLTGEYNDGIGRRSDFQNGSIVWTSAMGVQVQPERLSVDGANITFGSGIAVGGYAHLDVFSDGTTHTWGHLHDSGSAPYDCMIVLCVKDTEGHVYAAAKSGTVHGLDAGSRNLDWDDWGANGEIRQNWTKIRFAHSGGYRVDVTSDWTLGRIAELVGKIVGAVAALGALFVLIFGGGAANKSTNPNYALPENYPVGGEAPPSSGIHTIP